MTNQGALQQSIRDVTGKALDYNGDWHALFDMAEIPAGTFNERLLLWINGELEVSHTSLPSAMQAFAESRGAYNWSSLTTIAEPQEENGNGEGD